MKFVLFILLINVQLQASEAEFVTQAQALAQDVRSSLMKALSEKISTAGVEEAIPFCHENVKPLGKKAAGERFDKFEFGRTSHKVRNQNNAPKAWMLPYLEEFKNTTSAKRPDRKLPIVGKLEDGKRYYLEPLYVMPQCLNCHGEKINENVRGKITSLYPKDSATGFKLNEFRGFIWVKEK